MVVCSSTQLTLAHHLKKTHPRGHRHIQAFRLTHHGNEEQTVAQIGGEPTTLNKIAKQLAEGDINIQFDDTQVITGIHHSLRELTQSLTGIVKQAHQLIT